jgi:hypothetical protein
MNNIHKQTDSFTNSNSVNDDQKSVLKSNNKSDKNEYVLTKKLSELLSKRTDIHIFNAKRIQKY